MPALSDRFAAGLLLASLCLPVPALADAQTPSFAVRAALQVEGEGPWYRLELPIALRLAAAHGDLRDLRVLDATGQAQAYSLEEGREEYRQLHRETPVRHFPLYAAGDAAEVPAVRIRRSDAGTLVEVAPQSAPAAADQQLRGWLLDASGIDEPLQRLLLDWPEEAGEGFQQFSIEASDDLQHWKAWGTGQVARLSFGDERIQQGEVQLPQLSARYLRLLWQAPQQAPMLEQVRLVSVRGDRQPVPLVWSEPLVAGRSGDGSLLWELPLALPLARVRVEPIASGTLAPLRLSGRADVSQPWQSLASGVLYRLPQAGGERLNDELTLPGVRVRQLSLAVDARGGGLDPQPRLRVALPLTRVVFLARGQAPFSLALGNPQLHDQSLPLTTLVPGYDALQPPVFGQARVADALQVATPAVEAATQQAVARLDAKRLGLWVVLLAGVGLLVLMSLKLLRRPAEEV